VRKYSHTNRAYTNTTVRMPYVFLTHPPGLMPDSISLSIAFIKLDWELESGMSILKL
jgi:hypothetical protein